MKVSSALLIKRDLNRLLIQIPFNLSITIILPPRQSCCACIYYLVKEAVHILLAFSQVGILQNPVYKTVEFIRVLIHISGILKTCSYTVPVEYIML